MEQTNMNKNMTPPKGPTKLLRQSASPEMPGRKKDVRVFFFEENEESVRLSTGLTGQKLKKHISGMWKALTASEKGKWKTRQLHPAWVDTRSEVECATKIQKMWKTVKDVRKWRETRRWLVPYVVGMRAASFAKAAATSAMEAADRAISSAAALAIASEMEATAPKKKINVRTFYRVFFEKAVCSVLKLKGQKLKKHISGMWKALTKEEKAEWKWLSETMPMWLLDKSSAPDDAKYWNGSVLVDVFKKRAEMLRVIRETTGERWTFVRTTYYRFMDRPLRPICHWDPSIHKWRAHRIDQIVAARQKKCVEENEKTMAILETTRKVRYNHFRCCALITGHKSKISYALDSIFGTYEMSEEMMAEADKDWEKFMIAMYDMRDKPEWAHLVD